ncbi:MAG TPA: hypothetical protein VLA10_01605 [Ilumatobacter sp.]|nr:hypothetical protein [Ilumatobacter sp.]
MRFTQVIRIQCSNADALVQLQQEWDQLQSTSDVMGYIGTRLLANREQPGQFMIMAEFAEVDGDLTAADEAERNNQRVETEQWAAKLRSLVDGEPEWVHFDELYRTGITGNLRTG